MSDITFCVIRSRRRRKTEKEEDEEILKEEQGEDEEEMTVFTQSPACKDSIFVIRKLFIFNFYFIFICRRHRRYS